MGSGEHAAGVVVMDLRVLQVTAPWDWPKDAGQLFRETLLNKQASAEDRMIAVELGGDLLVMNDSFATLLLRLIGDKAEPPELRARAAISLGPALDQAGTYECGDPDDVILSERAFTKVQDTLKKLYRDTGTPKQVRRRILEASVRAPQQWHAEAIRKAFANADREWVLTAAFTMRFVKGFDKEILQAMENPDPEIHFEAVLAAGVWSLEAAWLHVIELVKGHGTPKRLLLAAIEAVGGIRPAEAEAILSRFTLSDDDEIVEAAEETLAMASGATEMDEDEWIH